jgi:hypothetical protein
MTNAVLIHRDPARERLENDAASKKLSRPGASEAALQRMTGGTVSAG